MRNGTGVVPLGSAAAHTCTRNSRLGHHNDCWLWSETDRGTYKDAQDRQQWITKLQEDTKYTPWGGETCGSDGKTHGSNGQAIPPRMNCQTALQELASYHASYLNANYEPKSIQTLKDGGCWSTIARKLGYRFEAVRSEFPPSTRPGATLTFKLTLKNVGWAPVYSNRPVFIRVTQAPRHKSLAAVPTDARYCCAATWWTETGCSNPSPGLLTYWESKVRFWRCGHVRVLQFDAVRQCR